jgi:hypothetical protein
MQMRTVYLLPFSLLFACVPPTRGWVVEISGVVAGSDGQAMVGVSVEILDDDGGTTSIARTDEDGVWRMPIMIEEGQEAIPWLLHLQASMSGYNDSDLFWHLSWLDESWLPIPLTFGPGQTVAVGQQTLPSILLFEKGVGGGSGTLVNAATGTAQPNIEVELRRGSGAPLSEAVVAIDTTRSDGGFAFAGLDSGVYTAVVQSQGGVGVSTFPVRLEAWGAEGQVGLVSPTLMDDELLAAITWSGDLELDMHLSGPLANYHGRYQVYADEEIHPVTGDDKDETVAELVFEAQGVEATMVYVSRDGEYRISSFDVTNELNSDSSAMSESDVVVYMWTAGDAHYETIGRMELGTAWMGLIYDREAGILHRPQRFSSEVDPTDVDKF